MNVSIVRLRDAVTIAIVAVASMCAGASADTSQVRLGAAPSLQPLAIAASKKFGLQYTGISIAVAPVASSDALGDLAGASIDVAFTDSAPVAKTMRAVPIAVVPFVFVTNRADGVSSLTAVQIADLLTGKTTNWNQIGGADVAVKVIGRGPASSAAQLVQRRYLGSQNETADFSVQASTQLAIDAVAKTSGAISVVGFDAARKASTRVTSLAIDGATPDVAHVGDGSYPLWTYAYGVTSGAPSGSAAKFLSFVENDRPMLESVGFIAVSDLGPGALPKRAKR